MDTYEKKYNEALAKAREIKSKILSSHLSTESCKAVSEYIDEIIPELRESEDERIRKELIEFIKSLLCNDAFDRYKLGSWIAWLEKKQEQKPDGEAEDFFDSAESYNQGFIAGQKKMKEDIEKGFGIGEHSLDYLAGRYAGYEAGMKEQKPAWSEEDKDAITTAIRACRYMTEKFENSTKQYEDAIERLKSLRPGWKPSEVHLSALLAVFNDPDNIGSATCQLALTDLYEQLKKL